MSRRGEAEEENTEEEDDGESDGTEKVGVPSEPLVVARSFPVASEKLDQHGAKKDTERTETNAASVVMVGGAQKLGSESKVNLEEK